MYLGHPPDVRLAKCPDCGFQFYVPRPTEDELTRIYINYRGKDYQKERQSYEPNYTEEFNSNLGQHPQEIANRRNNLIRLIKGHKIKTILDYGGDRGQLLPDVQGRYVYEISGIEPMVGVTMWTGTPKKFDLVMCCMLMEHLSDPVALFKELKSLGKHIFIEVPAKGPTYQDEVPMMHEHINFFTPKSLEIMTGGKFKIKEIDFGYDKVQTICGLI
jgi:hypothetical protein